MRFLFLYVVGQWMAMIGAMAQEAPPNPYQIFAEDYSPGVYHIPSSQSARVQGDPIPDMSQRPAELRPGAIPARVRYCFSTDKAMADAAELVTKRFCAPSHEGPSVFSKTLVVQPGAWAMLRRGDTVGKRAAARWGFLVWDGTKNRELSGIVLKDAEEHQKVEEIVRKAVEEGGGGTVHALTTGEMLKWWIFIGFDIQEPTLALETKDAKRRFVFGFVGEQIVVMDELNVFPDPKSTRGQ